LVFFLHLGQGKDTKWNLVIMLSTLTIVLIVVIGSIWIMNHLNYNMTPTDINNYMNDQGGGV
jgi:cytochrome o ubiquinol oxidase operon protein cyoD